MKVLDHTYVQHTMPQTQHTSRYGTFIYRYKWCRVSKKSNAYCIYIYIYIYNIYYVELFIILITCIDSVNKIHFVRKLHRQHGTRIKLELQKNIFEVEKYETRIIISSKQSVFFLGI